MTKHLLMLAISWSLTGCATFSKSAEDFRVQHSNVKSFCADANAVEVFGSLQSNLKRCYEHVGKMVRVNAMLSTPTYDQWIESTPKGEGGSHAIVTKDGYVMVADVSPGDSTSCPTKVQAYLMNAMWNRHVPFLKKAVEAGEPSCPM